MSNKATSSFSTALFEAIIYSLGVLFFILLEIAFGKAEFISIFKKSSLIDFTVTVLVVFVSIFVARLFGASSFSEIWKNGKSKEVSLTMVIGTSVGLITFLLLKAI
jgi:hypothetical protein